MKNIILPFLLLISTSSTEASDAPRLSTTTTSIQARAEIESASDSIKADIFVGEIFHVQLPCSPATGYEWRLKRVDRRIAAPAGPIKFQKADSGLIGGGGDCVLPIKGVKPGRTKAVLVYRRSWEKGAPAKIYTVRITVVANTPR